MLQFFNIKYIVVRPDNTGSPIVTPQAAMPYIESVFPVDKIHAGAGIAIYRVTVPPPAASLQINTADPPAPLYFGEGWGLLTPGQPITAQRKTVRLLLPLTGDPPAPHPADAPPGGLRRRAPIGLAGTERPVIAAPTRRPGLAGGGI